MKAGILRTRLNLACVELLGMSMWMCGVPKITKIKTEGSR